jgi:hypothetical protein
MKCILILTLATALSAQTPKTCDKGEYLTQDGRCLHDRTGEHMPAGDGCNTMTCMSPSCRETSETAMYCSHGDDPAWPVASGRVFALLAQDRHYTTEAVTSEITGCCIVRVFIPDGASLEVSNLDDTGVTTINGLKMHLRTARSGLYAAPKGSFELVVQPLPKPKPLKGRR